MQVQTANKEHNNHLLNQLNPLLHWHGPPFLQYHAMTLTREIIETWGISYLGGNPISSAPSIYNIPTLFATPLLYFCQRLKRKTKTYNSEDSLVVTNPTTLYRRVAKLVILGGD
jgi:hypothetical protein